MIFGIRLGRLLLILLVGFLIAAGVHGGAWYWSADRLETAIAQWTTDRERDGYAIEYVGPALGGFPFALKAQIAKPTVTSPDGWHWRGPSLAAEAGILAPLTPAFAFPGLHTVTLNHGDGTETVELEMERGAAVAELGADGSLESGATDMAQLSLRNDRFDQITVGRLTAELGPIDRGSLPQDARISFAGTATDATLPAHFDLPLGPEVQQVSLAATLTGDVGGGLSEAELAQWRDAGGNIDLHRGLLVWGPLEVDAKGALSLDPALRPLGELTARIYGLSGTLDLLTRQGLIESGQALAIELLLLTLTGERDEQGRSYVTLPISLRNGWLSLGPVQVFPLAPVL